MQQIIRFKHNYSTFVTMKNFFSALFVLSFTFLNSQSAKRPDNWFNLDPQKDSVNGVSTERSYSELLKNKTSKTVIVGVLDSGVDFNHEDLKEVMWTNEDEIPGNGVDDDKNGYVDDMHGWNFIGGKDGKNVNEDNLELTRLVRKFNAKYQGKTETDLKTKDEKSEYQLYMTLKSEFDTTKKENEANYMQYKMIFEMLSSFETTLKASRKLESVSFMDVKNYNPENQKEERLKAITLDILQNAKYNSLDSLMLELEEAYNHFKSTVEYHLNIDFDPRSIVGDDYSNSRERFYGNNDCNGPDSFHGTHVAGIIAASRKNGIGMDGVAADVKIMAVRCVPNGDERDKDVANGIRYAVDNGATILNMSFGKGYSWDKEVVDEAVRYAESKGVLIIHAAGNDAQDIDKVNSYPSKRYSNKKEASNFVVVGAISWQKDEKLVAPFSNYGKKTIDIFSPGVDIYSTAPHNKYKDASGTSMASPVACGVAAVLKSYYPELTPEQIKKILVKSSLKTYKGKKVIKPGTDELVPFEKLGKNAGLVNLYEAIKMAEKFSKTKT